MSMSQSWTIGGLRSQLAEFERELRAAGKSPATIQTYVDRAERFVRYLAGEYQPASN